MLTDHDKQATGNREPANEMNKEDPTQDIPVLLQPFTVNLEDLEAPVLAHSFERGNSDSESGCFKSGDTKNGGIVFMLTSAETKGDLFCEQKSMVT